ncbi:hypothetical protein D910_06614 [Dendroctonus ponderosae]|uniref:Tetraspanin n=1 Tax=Dendroctonus ponderosae TaxID=77166 RepID=U4UF68_DENPD|nr:hypothetical protein D910_06614 [Dendroctonus ponderosae]
MCGGFTCSKNALIALNMLYIYMLILFLLFLIQFSVACACLGVNQSQQEQLAQQGWNRVDNATRANVQKTFTCCGFDAEVDKLLPHPECFDVTMRCCSDAEHKVCDCPGGCLHKLQSTISYAFQLCGWIGLFFSFTEFMGVLLTVRYRNQKDPRANPSAFL